MAGVAQRAVKHAAVTADRLRRPARGVVVLIYHRVGARAALEIDMPTPSFDAQMAELAASGRAASLDDAVTALRGPTPPVQDPVVVTFDDGTADFADEAMPVLERHGIPATLYVATAFLEEQRPFPSDGAPLSWGALADAVGTGLVTVGSHTHTHALLDRLPATEAAEELDRSVAVIQDRLGVDAHHFAYPKAVPPSAAVEALVRPRFTTAALAGTRPNPYGRTDLHRLARSPIQVGDGMRWFRAKLAGGMALEDEARRLLNRVRYRGATT